MNKWIMSALLALTACEDNDSCKFPGTTRCHNNRVEECVGGEWKEEDNCDVIYMLDNTVEKWQCCSKPAATCEPTCKE